MFFPEQKLPIQVGNLDCIHVDNMNLLKLIGDKVLQHLTTDSSDTND